MFRRDTYDISISRHQSPKFWIWMRHLGISYLVISHDVWYDITIDRDISCDITPDHPKTPGENNFNENHHLVAVNYLFLAHCMCPLLGLSHVWPCLTSFCCPSAGHIILAGLTVPQQTVTLSPHDLACYLSACLFSLHFYHFPDFPVSCSFLLPGTPW